MKSDEQIIREIANRVTGVGRRTRSKPHRCIDCEKVTSHVRCDSCSAKRRRPDKP